MSILESYKKSLLFLPAILMFYTPTSYAFPNYSLSTFLDMSPGSAFATQYCGSSPCEVEGSTTDVLGNLYLAMAWPKGEIFKVTPTGSVSIYASFPVSDPSPTDTFNSVNLRLTFDLQGNLYAPFIDLSNYSTKTTDAMNGVWMIPPGGGMCSLTSGPCKKIWPQTSTSPVVRFVDGVAVDNKGSLYVADAQMGNIWKVNIAQKTAQLWAGVDANNGTNALEGNPADIALSSPEGRGLGVTGITIDDLAQNIYAVNFDNGSVIRLPINKNGTAAPQQVLLNLSSTDQELDAIHYDVLTQNLYVTRDEVGFIAFNQSLLTCIINGTLGTSNCVLAPFGDGHEVLATNVLNLELGKQNSVTFTTISSDTRLGVTTGVVPVGPALIGEILGSLYIDVFSSSDGTGPKVMKATPIS